MPGKHLEIQIYKIDLKSSTGGDERLKLKK